MISRLQHVKIKDSAAIRIIRGNGVSPDIIAAVVQTITTCLDEVGDAAHVVAMTMQERLGGRWFCLVLKHKASGSVCLSCVDYLLLQVGNFDIHIGRTRMQDEPSLTPTPV